VEECPFIRISGYENKFRAKMDGVYEKGLGGKYYGIIWGIISRFTEKFLTEWVSTPRLITSTSRAAYRGRELSSMPPESSTITRSRRPSLFSILIVRVI
jgi:hypothetical protein